MIPRNTAHHMAAQDLLTLLPDESINLIVTDPPYGKGYRSNETRSNGHKSRTTKATFGADTLDTTWLNDAYRVLKPDSAMYLFTQWDVHLHWHAAVVAAGFKYAMCIVWDKKLWGAGNLKSYGCQTEFVMLCTKGSHVVNGKRGGNLWQLERIDVINYEGNYDNPTQKPERLLMRAIRNSSSPGDLVLDPFGGSGSTASAARQCQRDYITGDIDAYQYRITTERLAKPYKTPLFTL